MGDHTEFRTIQFLGIVYRKKKCFKLQENKHDFSTQRACLGLELARIFGSIIWSNNWMFISSFTLGRRQSLSPKCCAYIRVDLNVTLWII
jgi:hypothetical protein